MALWGNNDNKDSGGTASVNYQTKVVTGSGTTFGQVGAAATGDVIRFGSAFGGTNGFFGDAVITGIAGTQSLTIDSTAGLSGGEISDSQFQISQSPKTLIKDAAQNQSTGLALEADRLKFSTTVSTRVAAGTTILFVSGNPSGGNVTAGETVQYGTKFPDAASVGTVVSVTTTSITIKSGTGSAIATAKLNYNSVGSHASGQNIVVVTERPFVDHTPLHEIHAGDTLVSGSNSVVITSVDHHLIEDLIDQRKITLAGNLTQTIPHGQVVSIERGVKIGDPVDIYAVEVVAGKESQVVGVSTAGAERALATAFETGVGWVGVTTYNDSDGSMRVKKEILVAMSGIQTGNTPIYDNNPFA
jgi:hypothetical protein